MTATPLSLLHVVWYSAYTSVFVFNLCLTCFLKEPALMGICPFWQWLFRKTGTMGTLASQAEIDVWVQAPGRFYGAGGQGISLRKNC